MAANVGLTKNASKRLDDLKAHRESNGDVSMKTLIVSDAIALLHKKEIKNDR